MRSIVLFHVLVIFVILIANVPRIFAIPVAESSPDALADAYALAKAEPVILGLFGKVLGSVLLRKVGTHLAVTVASEAIEKAVEHTMYNQEE